MKRRDFIWTCATITGLATLPACRPPRSREESTQLNADAFHAMRRMVVTPFGRIAYVGLGSGPAALFLHGFPLNGFQWRGALERLSNDRRCFAPDFVGMGYTDAPDQQDLSPPAQADMLAAFLDALSISSADVIANDSGTAVAQLFAVRHPTRVRTLLLTNGDVHENSPPAQLRNSIELAREGRYHEKLQRHLDDPEHARSSSGIGGSAYTDPANFTDEAIEYYFRPLVANPLRQSQLNRYLAAFDPNPLLAIEPELRRSTVPTRMVWGDADPLFPVAWTDWLDRVLPESRGVRIVAGANLFWPEEQPDVIAEEARKLWGIQRV